MYIMFGVHLIYNLALPFIHKDFHALFASAWMFTLFGYLAFRLIDDALNNRIKLQRDVKWTIGTYFIYRTVLNVISFLQSFEIDGSWKRYKTVTSNYYADAIIMLIILIVLTWILSKDYLNKRRCQRTKTI